MDKAFLKKLSDDEDKRVEEIISSMVSGDVVSKREIFGNNALENILDGSKSFLEGNQFNKLPHIIPFYKTILLRTCYSCPSNFSISSLEEYLKREMVVPVLAAPYEAYPQNFTKTIIKYPHISEPVGNLIKRTFMYGNDGARYTCLDCTYGSPIKKIVKNLKLLNPSLKDAVISSIAQMRSTRIEKEMVEELEKAVGALDKSKIENIFSLICQINNVRTSQSLSSTLILDLDKYAYLKKKINTNILEIHEDTLNVLRLSLPSDMNLEEYLDIVKSSRSNLKNIVSEYGNIKRCNENIAKHRNILLDLQAQVSSISKSKRGTFIESASKFIETNKSIIKSGIINLIGIGCIDNVRIPGKEIMEAYTSPLFERFLSIYFQKPLPLIQLYRLQRKIQKSNAS